MIKCFTFENFKSFEKAELNIEQLTTLIGTNASGKSNAIEGIRILAELATGMEVSAILDGTKSYSGAVRGGSSSCPRFRTSAFRLGCLVAGGDDYDLLYEIKIHVNDKLYVEEEGLYIVPPGQTAPRTNKLFRTKQAKYDGADIKVEYKSDKHGTNPDMICVRTAAILPQLYSKLPRETEEERTVVEELGKVIQTLRKVFVLDPVTQKMRGYNRISDNDLRSDCENISAALLKLCEEEGTKQRLLSMIHDLPENEISDIAFIETRIGDVIFTLRERYASSTEMVDARKLSDGTLRSIAVLTAVLMSPPGSVIVMEEIDNGVHPGRVWKLIEDIVQISAERGIDVILTTHNAMLLNQYRKKQLIGVSVAYRENEKGTSKLIPLLDVPNYPELLIGGGLGTALKNTNLSDFIHDGIWSTDKHLSAFRQDDVSVKRRR